MAATNGTSIAMKVVVAIVVAALSSAIGWLFVEVIEVRKDLDVLAAEKTRNEVDIQKMADRLSCIESGMCGDRYLNSWAIRDQALINQRLDWLEKNCVLKGN